MKILLNECMMKKTHKQITNVKKNFLFFSIKEKSLYKQNQKKKKKKLKNKSVYNGVVISDVKTPLFRSHSQKHLN